MTQTIALVASSNGLGHTRRLAQLASGLTSAGKEVHLFATKRNISLLEHELQELGVLNLTVPVPPIGLDSYLMHGSQFLENKLEKPSIAHDILKQADVVLSDNSLWPITVNSNVWTFGHFLWTDYYKASVDKLSEPTLESRLKCEIELAREVKGRFLLSAFQQSDLDLDIETHFVPMLRYLGDDSAIYDSRNSNEIWVSIGTTGRSKFAKFETERVRRLETHNFRLGKLPRCVLGRPGLGTIRDCLAFSVPFFPISYDSDVELELNIQSLQGGINQKLPRVESWDSIAKLDTSSRTLRLCSKRLAEFWNRISASRFEVADLVLDSLS